MRNTLQDNIEHCITTHSTVCGNSLHSLGNTAVSSLYEESIIDEGEYH